MIKNISEIIAIRYIIGTSLQNFPKFYDHFKGKSNLSALDLGCRIPIDLFNLYHLFDFKRLVGVDSNDEQGCVYQEKVYQREQDGNKDITGTTFYEVYNQIYKSEVYEKPKIESKEEFNNIFLNSFINKDIDGFLQDNNERFDIIIASNILHLPLIHKLDWHLEKIKSSLREEGIVYIKIQNGNKLLNKGKVKASIRKFFNKGVLSETSRDGKWHDIEFINFEYK